MTQSLDSGLSTISLVDLIGQTDRKTLTEAGVVWFDRLASPGYYTRTKPTIYNLDVENAVGARYQEDLGRSIQVHPALHRVVLNDAVVTGQGVVITRDGRLIIDSCQELFLQKTIPTGLRKRYDGTLELLRRPSTRVNRASMLLKRPFWSNYGHWLLDVAALLALLPGIRMPDDWQMITGGQVGAMRTIAADGLDLLAPGIPVQEQQDHDTWVFDELHYLSPVSGPGLFKLPVALTALRARVLGNHRATGTPRRLYISRGPDDRRRLTNEEEILEICRAHGFEVIRPEEHSWRDQVLMFHTADVVMGIKGAGLTNILFCTSAAAAIVLTPAGWRDPFFWDLAGQAGLDYREIIGEFTGHVPDPTAYPFSVDPNLVVRALEDLHLARQARGPGFPTGVAGTDTSYSRGHPMEQSVAGTVLLAMSGRPDMAIAFGERPGDWVAEEVVEGFTLICGAEIAPEEIEYRGLIGRNWPTPWVTGGMMCGTRGLNVPLFGFTIRLKGEARQKYRVMYDATFADGSTRRAVPAGEDCRADTLVPVVSMAVHLRPRRLGD